jgi:hypothetical protein
VCVCVCVCVCYSPLPRHSSMARQRAFPGTNSAALAEIWWHLNTCRKNQTEFLTAGTYHPASQPSRERGRPYISSTEYWKKGRGSGSHMTKRHAGNVNGKIGRLALPENRTTTPSTGRTLWIIWRRFTLTQLAYSKWLDQLSFNKGKLYFFWWR